MNRIMLTDYDVISKLEDYNWLADIETEINNKGSYIYVLEKDDEELKEKGVKLVSRFHDKLMTQQYIGIVQRQDTTVFIKSRFDNGDNSYFTNYVLSKALNIKSFIFPNMSVEVGREAALQKLLIIVFMHQINEVYNRGILRSYRVYKENNDKLKGKIDVVRHVKENMLFAGKIAYEHREYTIDNEVNRLIFTAYVMMEQREPLLVRNLLKKNREAASYFRQLRNVIHPASRQEIPKLIQRNRKKISHSIYRCWDDVRQTAILFLQNAGVNIAKEDSKTIYGVLIDMNRIWEMYLMNIFETGKVAGIKAQEKKEILFEVNSNSSQSALKPDFLLENKLVLDAKYKRNWSEVAAGKVNTWPREDVFQVLSYMYLFGCNRGGIICPATDEAAEKIECGLEKKDDFKSMTLFPLKIPNEGIKSYEDFEEKMKTAEEKLIQDIKEILS